MPGQRKLDRMITYFAPIDRRPTRSKKLGYDPGVLEAFRASHFTGLLDRLAVKKGLIEALPPKGAVETASKIPSLNISLDTAERLGLWEESLRSETARDYTRLEKRKSLYRGEYMSQQNLKAVVPTENIRRMQWEQQG